ncbi:MAG: DUF3987 domain-containing protein [Alphaproteobacteria bacterium]|nr:DUF3987 domain-containing protein [Alphaproteobacteria bacterium]
MSAEAAAMATPPPAADEAAILAFLTRLHGRAMRGAVEVAWKNKQGALANAELFLVETLELAAAKVAQVNAVEGADCYVGAAIRKPGTFPHGRTSDADFLEAWALHADFDKPGAVEEALRRAGKLDIPPSGIVTTGTLPHWRAHLWWLLEEPITNPVVYSAALKALALALGGDPTVTNPGRVMRLPGTVAWPWKEGRERELTEFAGGRGGIYPFEQFARMFMLAGPLREAPNKPRAESATAPNEPRVGVPDEDGIVRAVTGLGLDGPVIDGREKYMRDTLLAVALELAGALERWPTGPEIADAAWPQYAAHVDLSRPGRGRDELDRKAGYLADRLARGAVPGVPGLEELIRRYRAKQQERARQEAPGAHPNGPPPPGSNDAPHAGPADGWPEPQPLPDGLPPVAAFDFAMLPESLQPWAADICERIQCPPDFVGVAVMAGLGAVVGRKIAIRPQAQTDWSVTPNQWALVIGRPGVLKSPALEAALAPIKRLAAKATEAHEGEFEVYERAVRLAELKAEEGKKAARKALAKSLSADVAHFLDSDAPEAPTLRRYIANDSTAAALGELLRQNPNGLLVFRDELVSLLRSLDREDNAEARGFYLTSWNGDSGYTFDRIERGLNLHIPAVCLSLLGSTQPGRVAEYIRHAVRGGAGDDGLIQRFGLLVWPDASGAWRDVDRWPDGEAKRAAFGVFEGLDRLDPATVGAERDVGPDGEPDGVPFLRFDTGGHGLFLEWRTALEAKLRSGELHPALESHLAKYRKLVPGLALLCHLADGGVGPVGEVATLKALAWVEYLETHARRAYASVSMPEVPAAKAILDRIRKGDLPREFAGWGVWRPGWALLGDRQQVADALGLLVDLGWLAAHQKDTGGRPSMVYAVNPRGLWA